MTLFLRLCFMALVSLRQPKMGSMEELSKVSFRVWLTDLDQNIHLNNARYFTLMEAARLNMSIRSGLLSMARKEKWALLIGSETIQFRRSFKFFDKVTVLSRVVYWNEKWIYIEQKFEKDGELYAVGWVKVMVRSKAGAVSPIKLVEILNYPVLQKEIPPSIAHWKEMDRSMRRSAEQLV